MEPVARQCLGNRCSRCATSLRGKCAVNILALTLPLDGSSTAGARVSGLSMTVRTTNIISSSPLLIKRKMRTTLFSPGESPLLPRRNHQISTFTTLMHPSQPHLRSAIPRTMPSNLLELTQAQQRTTQSGLAGLALAPRERRRTSHKPMNFFDSGSTLTSSTVKME